MFTAGRKKKVERRGYQKVRIKTLNGCFDFRVRKYVVAGQSTNWLQLSQAHLTGHYESVSLVDFALEYAKYMSYERVSALVGQRMGNGKLSDQHIYHLVNGYAESVKHQQLEDITVCKSIAYTCKSMPVDIYSSESEEVIFLSDGVCVNEQKAKRDKIAKKGKERTTTDIMLLQTAIGDKDAYKPIIAAHDVDPIALVQSECLKAYGEEVRVLPIVSISDGARCIKNQNKAIFGEQVVHILDWYHIQSKVTQLMSQIAVNKASKEEYIKLIINYLWYGNTIAAVLVLKFMLFKNQAKRDELVGYLEKNADHIIDYERRKAAGKIIGSGRTEKQNDCIVSKRQKRKGMSWSPTGSKNLAILTAYHSYAA